MMQFRSGGVGHNQREATNRSKTDRDRLVILQTEDLVNKTRDLEGMEVEARVENSNRVFQTPSTQPSTRTTTLPQPRTDQIPLECSRTRLSRRERQICGYLLSYRLIDFRDCI
jgi:hypothetical protein